MGMEKCGKMCENVENVEKCAGDPFSIYYLKDMLIVKVNVVFLGNFTNNFCFKCDNSFNNSNISL